VYPANSKTAGADFFIFGAEFALGHGAEQASRVSRDEPARVHLDLDLAAEVILGPAGPDLSFCDIPG